MIRSSGRIGPDRVMCCSRTEMTVGLGKMTEAFQATHRSRGAAVGVAGSMLARTSHRRTDNQPSKENASLALKTWIYADETQLRIDLFPPATEIFVKLEAREPTKRRSVVAPESISHCQQPNPRPSPGAYLVLKAWRGFLLEDSAMPPAAEINADLFAKKRSSEPSPGPSSQRGRGRKS